MEFVSLQGAQTLAAISSDQHPLATDIPFSKWSRKGTRAPAYMLWFGFLRSTIIIASVLRIYLWGCFGFVAFISGLRYAGSVLYPQISFLYVEAS